MFFPFTASSCWLRVFGGATLPRGFGSGNSLGRDRARAIPEENWACDFPWPWEHVVNTILSLLSMGWQSRVGNKQVNKKLPLALQRLRSLLFCLLKCM